MSGYPYVENIEANKFVSTIRNSKNSKERYADIDAYDPPAHDKFYTIFVLPKYDSSRYGAVIVDGAILASVTALF